MYGTYSVGQPTSAHFEGLSASNYIEPDPALTQDVFDVLLSTVHSVIPDLTASAGMFLDKVQDQLNGGYF